MSNMDQIISIIQENIKNDVMRFLPRIANRKLSFHELEAIFFNHGNGYKLYMSEHNDSEGWENLSQKDKNSWNSKAKKQKSDSLAEYSCKAKKKDGSDCTTVAKENGYCGKHKDNEKSDSLIKKLASQEKKEKEAKKEEKTGEIKMKRKKIDGVIYYVDDDNKVFDIKTKELKGIYNPETKKIDQDDDFFDNSSMDEAEPADDAGSEIVDSDAE